MKKIFLKFTILTLVVIGYLSESQTLATCIKKTSLTYPASACGSVTTQTLCENTCADGYPINLRVCYDTTDWNQNGMCMRSTSTPIDGTCGSAQNTPTSTGPIANLCATGTPTTVRGEGPYIRGCLGTNGGATASCSVQGIISGASACTNCRPVQCRDQNGNTVADSFCNSLIKPATGQQLACNLNTYGWTGTWGPCTLPPITCEALTSDLGNIETCDSLTTTQCASPSHILSCILTPSGTSTQIRTSSCYITSGVNTGNVVADMLCPQPKPATTSQACNNIPTINGHIYTCQANGNRSTPQGTCTQATIGLGDMGASTDAIVCATTKPADCLCQGNDNTPSNCGYLGTSPGKIYKQRCGDDNMSMLANNIPMSCPDGSANTREYSKIRCSDMSNNGYYPNGYSAPMTLNNDPWGAQSICILD